MDEVRRAYYLKNVYKKKEYAAWIKRQKKIAAIEYKGGKCERCGQVYPACVYDFHHLDPTIKEAAGSQFLGWSWKRIKSEIDKCLLLCSNCHRLEHYNNKEWFSPKKGNLMNDQVNTEVPQFDIPPELLRRKDGEPVPVQTEADKGKDAIVVQP